MLSGSEIINRMATGDIVIDPFVPEHVGPNSVDLRLSDELLIYDVKPQMRSLSIRARDGKIRTKKGGRWTLNYAREARLRAIHAGPKLAPELEDWNGILDMKQEPHTMNLLIPDKGLDLVPGRLYIGSTMEYTETQNLVPGIEGRSSIGRLGIDVHATAGFGDVGFKGTWTLEISVTHPIRVYAGVRVCQLYYEPVTGQIKQYDSSKYQGQRGPRASGLWKDFDGKEAQ